MLVYSNQGTYVYWATYLKFMRFYSTQGIYTGLQYSKSSILVYISHGIDMLVYTTHGINILAYNTENICMLIYSTQDIHILKSTAIPNCPS